MIYFLAIYALVKLYMITNIYQQSHYKIRVYIKYFLYNFIYYDLCVMLSLIVGLYTHELIFKIISISYILVYSLLYFSFKIKLKFTNRIKRLIIISIIYILLIMNIKYISPYLLILIEFSILPILYLDVLLANLLNKKYIKNAKLKLANYKGVKICITGSYGKTSTKSLFNQMLNIYYNSVSAKKSYNTELGVSKFVNSIDIDLYDYLVLEYASAKKNDISKLCNIGIPDVAVVTEVGYMHLDTFKNINTILDEKMSIIKDARIVILNYDNEYIREYKIEDRIVLSYGFNYGIYNAKNIKNGSFDFYYRDVFVMHFDTKLIGRHQILNLLCVLAYAHYMNFNLDKLVNALKLFKLESNRLEIKNINNNIIIDDSFNSNINGFIEALRILGNYNKKRILLTPGLVELGKYEKEIYNNLSNHIINNCDIVILVGYNECRYLYYLIKSYNLEIYVVRDFKEGYKLYLELIKDYKDAVLLIENDLPDIYIKRFIF